MNDASPVQAAPLDFDPDALREKYRQEREKRLRADGEAQYPAVTLDGQAVPMYDLMGKDATLFHYAIDDDSASMASQYVEQARAWFDAVWHTVGRQP